MDENRQGPAACAQPPFGHAGGPSEGRAWFARAGGAIFDAGAPVRVAVIGLFLLASLHAAAVARPVLLPLLLALLLSAVLSAPVSRLHRLGAPRPLGAALVVAALLAVLGAGFGSLAEPARQWLERAPSTLERIERKLSTVKHSVEEVRETARKVGEVASVGDAPRAAPKVQVAQQPDTAQRLVSAIPDFTVGAVSTIALLYFLLASGDQFFRSLVWCVPALSHKRRAVRIARKAKSEYARYLATVTRTNVLLGGATALVTFALGMPNPLLWGALAGVLNFVPYLGPLTSLCVIALASIASFDSLGDALAPPAAFLLLTVLEGQILAPMVIGARFTVHPLFVTLATLLGGWSWGVGGTVIAVPALMAVKIACEHIDSMKPLARVLGPGCSQAEPVRVFAAAPAWQRVAR